MGQEILYKLLVKKDVIPLEAVKKVYINYGCRHTIDGVPYLAHYVEDSRGNYTLKHFPMNDWQLQRAVFNWLTHNLGVLIIKGFLDMTPLVSLQELEQIQTISNETMKKRKRIGEDKK